MQVDIAIGHGPQDGWQGASANGLSEYIYNSSILRPMIDKIFENTHYTIRWWDASEHPEWRASNKKSNLLLLDQLTAMYKADPPVELAINLHNNASTNPNVGGFMAIFRYEKNAKFCQQSFDFGYSLCRHLKDGFSSKQLNIKNLGPRGDQSTLVGRNLAFTRWMYQKLKVPGIILELGFLTHKPDVAILTNNQTPNIVAQAILNAVHNFYISGSYRKDDL